MPVERRVSSDSPLKFLAFVFVALLAASVMSFAQTDDLMQREIDQALETSRWQAGPFRLTPVVRVGGGVDSNPLGQPGSDPVQDVTFLVGPGIRGVVPMGDRGLVDFYQEVDFVYFRDLEQLRDISNVTRAGGSIGGRDFVLHVEVVKDDFRIYSFSINYELRPDIVISVGG